MRGVRARRSVLVLDAGERRNRFASHSHAFLGQDGQSPDVIAAKGRAEVLAYATVTWREGLATEARSVPGGPASLIGRRTEGARSRHSGDPSDREVERMRVIGPIFWDPDRAGGNLTEPFFPLSRARQGFTSDCRIDSIAPKFPAELARTRRRCLTGGTILRRVVQDANAVSLPQRRAGGPLRPNRSRTPPRYWRCARP